jgi:sugar/nucleoside kinase (ribokinase family)
MNVYALGNLTLDIVASHVPDLPRWGTEVMVDSLLFRTAGNLGNFCLALAAMGIPAVPIGNLGQDRDGALILEELRKAGLDTRSIRVEEGARTSISITVVKNDGERLFLTFPGQLKMFTRTFVDSYIDRLEDGSLVILCSLFQLPNLPPAEVAEIAAALKKKRCTVLVDPGWDPYGWQPNTVQGVRRLLSQVDYFLPNLEEAGAIAGSGSENRVLGFLKECGAANIIIKKGASGCLAWLDGRLHRSRAYATTPIDTTGAGDVFNAAIVYGLRNGIETGRMLDLANAAASLSIARPTNRYPQIVEIEMAAAQGLREEQDER